MLPKKKSKGLIPPLKNCKTIREKEISVSDEMKIFNTLFYKLYVIKVLYLENVIAVLRFT